MLNNSNDIRKILEVVGRILGSAFGVWGVAEILEYFGFEPLKDNQSGFLLFISISLNIWFFIEWALTERQKLIVNKRKSLSQILLEELEELWRGGNYEAVLRYRESFSRSLWVEGKPWERIRLGEIAEDSAAKLDDRLVQAASLIDDLGWTLVSVKKYDKAKDYILHGYRIAKELNSYYWMAKAHRHLSGIYIEAKKYSEAFSEMELARRDAESIETDRIRWEMLAGIEYSAALIYVRAHDLDKANEHLTRTEELRSLVGDKTRTVKIFALKGLIAEVNSDFLKARDYYRRGLEESTKVGRRDEMIKNHLGLSRVLMKLNEKDEAREHQKEAERMMQFTPVPFQMENAEMMLRNIVG